MPDPDAMVLPQELLIAGAAVRVGLFDALKEGPHTLEELASRTRCDMRALWNVTEALVALGYLEHVDGRVGLTREARSMLYDPESESYTGFSFMHTWNLIPRWMALPEIMRTGKPAPREDDPEESKDFIAAMSHYAGEGAARIAEHCLKGLPKEAKVLDVGGGPLTIATAFAKQGAGVTVLDLPEVIDMMAPQADPGLRIDMVKGDFTEWLPEGPFDLVYLGNVCHIYGEEENRKLFAACAKVLRQGGRLVINDFIRGTSQRADVFAVNMLVNTESGGTWTYEEYETWLGGAGLAARGYEEVGGRQLIMATKV